VPHIAHAHGDLVEAVLACAQEEEGDDDDDTCYLCQQFEEGVTLLVCEACERVAHKKCAKLRSIPKVPLISASGHSTGKRGKEGAFARLLCAELRASGLAGELKMQAVCACKYGFLWWSLAAHLAIQPLRQTIKHHLQHILFMVPASLIGQGGSGTTKEKLVDITYSSENTTAKFASIHHCWAFSMERNSRQACRATGFVPTASLLWRPSSPGRRSSSPSPKPGSQPRRQAGPCSLPALLGMPTRHPRGGVQRGRPTAQDTLPPLAVRN